MMIREPTRDTDSPRPFSGHSCHVASFVWSGKPVKIASLADEKSEGLIRVVEGRSGHRAVIAGTGLDVWEIIATWRGVGESYKRLKTAYHWLSEAQLRAALEYYERHPQEIEERLEREERWTPESVWQEYPFARPGS